MRYDKEAIAAKFEWEGSDAIEWFEPHEVPEEVQALWAGALDARKGYNDELDRIYKWLESDDQE